MNHDAQQFQYMLCQLREMGDVTREEACKVLGIGHSIHTELRAVIRAERGELTQKERVEINAKRVLALVGDGDPATFSRSAIAKSLGITQSSARSARNAAIEMRRRPRQPTPKRPKAERLFRVEGARLFSMNREPMEVGG
jgi:hypothetical protein